MFVKKRVLFFHSKMPVEKLFGKLVSLLCKGNGFICKRSRDFRSRAAQAAGGFTIVA
jgi:hypothetical protein